MAPDRTHLDPGETARRKAFVRQLTRAAYEEGRERGLAEAVAAVEADEAASGEGLHGIDRRIDTDPEVRWGNEVVYTLLAGTIDVPAPPLARQSRLVSVQQERGRAWLLHWLVTCPELAPGILVSAVFRLYAGTGSASLTWPIVVPIILPELRGTVVIPFARLDVDPELPVIAFLPEGTPPLAVHMAAGVTPVVPGGD